MSMWERLVQRVDWRLVPRNAWWALLRLAGFVYISVRLAFVHPEKLRTHVPGNPGDAFLILSLLKWGGDHVTSLFSGYWQGPMFSSGHDAMAYTDTFLPLTVPFRVIEEVTRSPIIAMNVVYIAGWVLCAECTYHFLVRLSSCRSASVVGSLAFTFSTIRMAQTGHFQLVFAFCIPLSLLLLFRLAERPTISRGALLGLALSTQFLTTAYYGLILIVSVVGLATVIILRAPNRSERLKIASALGASAVILLVLVAPVALRYSSIQSSSDTRGTYPAEFALRIGDLRTAAPLSTHLNHYSFLRNNSASRSGENYAFVGLFVLTFVGIFLVALVASRSFRRRVLIIQSEMTATVLVGLFAFVIAIGRGPIFGISMPLYGIASKVIPGVKSMLAIVRLFVFTQLALVVLATLALVWVLTHIQIRAARVGIGALLSLLVVWESSAGVPLVRVPTVQAGSVYSALRRLDSGIAVELPMAPRGAGVTYAFLEATRMMLSAGDGDRTVNGYSGFAPPDYDSVVEALNTFPSAASYEKLKELHVAYVVVHTKPVDTGLDPVSDLVNASGFAYVSGTQLSEIVDDLPNDRIADEIMANDGLVLVLDHTG